MYSSLWTFPSSFLSDFDRLHREFDEHFGGIGAPSSIRSTAPGAFPAINVGNTPEALEVYAFAPGIDAAKLEVTVDRGVLTIAGERPSDLPQTERRNASNGGNGSGSQGDNQPSVFSRERGSGSFRRAISLPDDADPAQVTARYRDGVLHISVARKQAAQPTRITVQ